MSTMMIKRKTELIVKYVDKRTKTQVFKAVAGLAGVDEVKILKEQVMVIGEVDPAKLCSEIKKVGVKESCFGYMKGGKELVVEIVTVGKPPEKEEKPKCKTCNELCCEKCKKCHKKTCKDCVRCCCEPCQSCSPPPPVCCDKPIPTNPYCHYKGGSYAQFVEYPPYYDNYGGNNGCFIL